MHLTMLQQAQNAWAPARVQHDATVSSNHQVQVLMAVVFIKCETALCRVMHVSSRRLSQESRVRNHMATVAGQRLTVAAPCNLGSLACVRYTAMHSVTLVLMMNACNEYATMPL
jgi:hypothetical protein